MCEPQTPWGICSGDPDWPFSRYSAEAWVQENPHNVLDNSVNLSKQKQLEGNSLCQPSHELLICDRLLDTLLWGWGGETCDQVQTTYLWKSAWLAAGMGFHC